MSPHMKTAAASHATAPSQAGALPFLTIAEAAALIEKRALSRVELPRALLDRIDVFDSQINAFITITAELALKQARVAEREIAARRYRGAMHGIPFAVKDIIDTAGILTTAQSKILADNGPAADAAPIE